MPVSVDRALTVGRPMAAMPHSVWVPCWGGLWVVANMLLIALGVRIVHPLTCSFLAGVLNGTILSVIAVARASERFQAGTTGLLGGFGLSGLRHDGSMLLKGVDGIHAVVDQALIAVNLPMNEALHDAIEQEVLCAVWTTLFIVLASLIADWVYASRKEI